MTPLERFNSAALWSDGYAWFWLVDLNNPASFRVVYPRSMRVGLIRMEAGDDA